jgi:hypothetical protein
MAYIECPNCGSTRTRRLKGFYNPKWFGDDEKERSPDGEIYIGYCYYCGSLYYYVSGTLITTPEAIANRR